MEKIVKNVSRKQPKIQTKSHNDAAVHDRGCTRESKESRQNSGQPRATAHEASNAGTNLANLANSFVNYFNTTEKPFSLKPLTSNRTNNTMQWVHLELIS